MKKNLSPFLKIVIWLCFLVAANSAFATHNRAGEITYKKLSNLLYEVKIVTYTKTSSPADRPELEFWWGDGQRDTLQRIQIDFNVGPDIQRNVYIGTHTYPGNGSYIMYFLDENRNADVKNIAGSVNIPFYVETKLVISPAITTNNSPQLLQPPIDNGSVGQIFIHNPNAYDPDGDSLSYELVPCKGANGQPIPTFSYPGANNSFSLEPVIGDLIWDSPLQIGEYNVAMIIREWRNIPGIGTLNIGYVTRDMQITIYPPVNDPPIIASIKDTCILAGSTLAFTVNATEPNGEQVTLSASGGPFVTPISPSTFTSAPGIGSTTGDFNWVTDCSHVRKNPFTVVFKAVDNNTQVQLVDLEQLFITVVAPAPQNPLATPQGNSLVLNWDTSLCPQAIGYKIYRRIGSYGFSPSDCEVGVPAYTGYSLIGQINGYSNTTFTDNNSGVGLAPAVQYCYMVVAVFPDGAESYASIEFCGTLIRDLPVITNVDVNSTDLSTGTIYVAWGKPTELDTLQTPGPYRYVLQRADQSGNYVDVVTYNSLNDTTFNDVGLNTSAIQYRYRINFWNDTPGNTFLVGTTQVASSVFLSVGPGDEKNNLSWNFNVPWTNTNYEIYRKNTSGVFVLIGTTTSNSYVDDSLQNGINYCYYVTTYGAYLDTGLVNPIINKSQEACSTPIDNEPPCVPQFLNTAFCELLTDSVAWIIDDSCASDLQTVQIYFQAAGNDSYVLLASVSGSTNNYVYTSTNSIAGCFYITATDSTGNISFSSDTICVDPCPLYELPNVFTPDNNGVNDLFHPILPYRDVKDIEIKIFNRWGALMFETTNPDINWNGKRNNDGEDAPEGVYFYICKVNQASTNVELKQTLLKGTIQLLRGDKVK